MRTKSELSPYLVEGRLANVIAALQTLAARARPEGTIADLTQELSRSKEKNEIDTWTRVFEEHPEFFLTYRLVGKPELKAALRWRYVNRNFDEKTGTTYTPQEKENLSKEQQALLTTKPLAGDQVSTLLNTAIELHSRAVEERVAARWWVPILAAFLGFTGAVIGAIVTSIFGAHK
ncbi:MAG TPA: hypothetical protein VIE65_19050 [Methylobacter sp.]|jgi:hypothetical protein